MSAPRQTTTMTAAIRAVLAAMDAHAWPSPIAQIGLRGPLELIDPETALKTPALYLHVTSRRGEDPPENATARVTTGSRILRRCQWQVYCLLGAPTRDLGTEIYEMSEAVCTLVERREYGHLPRLGNRWGLGAAVWYPQALEDVDVDLGVQGIAARLVQWEQALYLPELASVVA